MKHSLLIILLAVIAHTAFSQSSDFIVLKKRNNRTLKTYFGGAFISAYTYDGFWINGFIKDIRNDSIIIQQEERRVVTRGFGTELDTIVYLMSFNYKDIKQFNYTSRYTWGRKRGFSQISIPKLMILGGLGYLALELVNTAYRGESINDHNKLASLGIAAGVAATGFAIHWWSNHNNKAGGKYKVIYVKNKK